MQTRKALKALSKGEIDYNTMNTTGPLASRADSLLQSHNQREASIKAEQQRHDVAAAVPVLQAAREKIDKIMGDSVMPDDTPIVSRFDAFSVIKDASKQISNDIGIKRFATHLERLWHQEPLGTISAGTLTRLRDHYQYNNPNSRVAEVIDTVIPKVSFNTLPVAKLVRIASEIKSQEDYDVAIMRNGLQSDAPAHVRARTFIRALLNQKEGEDMGEYLDESRKKEEGQFDDLKEIKDTKSPIMADKKRGSDVATRVAEKINKKANEISESEMEASSDVESEDKPRENLGIDGTGVMPVAAQKDADAVQPSQLGTMAIEFMNAYGQSDEITKKIDSLIANTSTEDLESIIEEISESPIGTEAYEYNKKRWIAAFGSNRPALMLFAALYRNPTEIPKMQQLLSGALEQPAVAPQQAVASRKIAQEIEEFLESEEGVDLLRQSADSFIEANPEIVELFSGGGGESEAIDDESEAMEVEASKKKKTKKKDKSTNTFSPKVNEQQPGQVTPPQSLKAAITADNPMVDDGQNHLPIYNDKKAHASIQYVTSLQEPPAWWLGSVDELKVQLREAIKAGKIPPQFEKHVKGKDKDKKDDKDEDKGGFPENLKKKKSEIEQLILNEKSYNAGGYNIGVKNDMIHITSKRGSKEYPLLDMDSAIADFFYLASTAKHPAGSPPPPVFAMREGIRLNCPACGESNSYEMPKEASDLSCGRCAGIVPARAIASALEIGGAAEETTLTAFVADKYLKEFGDVFAKAAELLNAQEIGVEGNNAEAYAFNVPVEKKAEAWDMMVEAGFKPIALDVEDINLPEGGLESPEPMMVDSQPLGGEGEEKIRTAMEHYHDKGDMNIVDAIAQFKTDYSEEFDAGKLDPQAIVDIAQKVFNGSPMEMAAALGKLAGDLPSTTVNQQQPAAVAQGKGNAVLGPDSDTKGEISTPGGIKSQSKPQGTFSDTSTEPDSDNRDPGDFGAGKPKAHHPATDQQGVGLSDTELGKDSDHQENKLTRKMDQMSKAAPSVMRSK